MNLIKIDYIYINFHYFILLLYFILFYFKKIEFEFDIINNVIYIIITP